MNDPWDVKSVRRPHQYQSFMKINGVPLLPPVLSKECMKEMQYYKLLAKEVEKRIKCLKPYVDMETVEEVPGALELTSESEEKTDETEGSCLLERYCHPSSPLNDNMYKAISSNVTVKTTDPSDKSMNMLFGFNVSINNSRCGNSSPKRCKASIEVPERDYNCPKKPESLLNEFENVQNLKTHKKGLGELTELNQAIKNEESERKPMLKKEDREMGQALRKTEIGQARKKESAIIKASTKRQPEMNQPLEEPDMKQSLETEITTISLSKDKSDLSKLLKTCYDNIEEEFIPFKIEASLRSFTGSLHDINADSSKSPTPLVRQRSYTVLKPSPLLIQHLQLQAKNTGVDLKLISMSESLSNIPQLQKKKRRRSWDLETAKSQWSTMALDLKRNAKPVLNLNGNAKTSAKQHNPSPYLTNSADRCRKPIPRNTKSPKSDPIQRSKLALSKNNVSEKSYLKISQPAVAANKIDKNGGPPAQTKESPPKVSPHSPIPAADDPATKVRELYEKIQKQQIDQMTNLVEKQKQEQMLLQQVFEEQNNMLFKQLKSICPEPTVEIKQAWCEKNHNAQRGPVSLSQLINHSPIESAPQSTVAKTLIPQSPGSPNNLSHRGDKSKRSSQMSNIKYNNHSVRPRARVVTGNNASRKLNYDNSGVSSDYEPMLTDRTNDTMADLNVTFPTDNSDESPPCKNSPRRTNTDSPSNIHQRKINSNSKYTDNAIRCLENSIQKTMHTVTALTKQHTLMNPIPQEREAATKIVAYAKGYLVRRLMRTERVQSTVATIRDALLCALQLHQDREDIRGADVDLHRRLIQQITAACYHLHDTFITSTPAERCSVIAADRKRRRVLATRLPTSRVSSYSEYKQETFGPYPPSRRPSVASIVTQATTNYETHNNEKSRAVSRRQDKSPTRRAWRN